MRNWTPPATISSTTSTDPVAAAHPCLQRDKARNRRRLTPNLRHGLQRQWHRASGQRSRVLRGHNRAPVLQDRNGTAGAAGGDGSAGPWPSAGWRRCFAVARPPGTAKTRTQNTKTAGHFCPAANLSLSRRDQLPVALSNTTELLGTDSFVRAISLAVWKRSIKPCDVRAGSRKHPDRTTPAADRPAAARQAAA